MSNTNGRSFLTLELELQVNADLSPGNTPMSIEVENLTIEGIEQCLFRKPNKPLPMPDDVRDWLFNHFSEEIIDSADWDEPQRERPE